MAKKFVFPFWAEVLLFLGIIAGFSGVALLSGYELGFKAQNNGFYDAINGENATLKYYYEQRTRATPKPSDFLIGEKIAVGTSSFTITTTNSNLKYLRLGEGPKCCDSMGALLGPNTKVLINIDPNYQVKVGDIIFYNATWMKKEENATLVVHRINDIDEKGIWVRGDANFFYDKEPINRSQIVGIVVGILY